MTAKAYQQYFETRIQTASPGHLVVMLYDGLLRFLKQTRRGLEQGDADTARMAADRAAAILQELVATLNLETGEIAANLLLLYEFSLTRLLQAQLKREPEMLDAAIQALETLRDAWHQIAVSAAPTQSQTPAATPAAAIL